MVGKVKNYLVQQRLVKASENKTSILDYQRKWANFLINIKKYLV